MPTFVLSESTTFEIVADTAEQALEIYLTEGESDERVAFVGVNERTVEEKV